MTRIKKTPVFVYILLIVCCILFLIPIYMTLITSLKRPAEIDLATAWRLPQKLFWQSYAVALETLLPNLLNSIILVISGTVISSVLGSINGYIFSKIKFKGSDIVFTLFLFGMFIPYQIILIPLFQTLRILGLYGSLQGLILAHVVYGIPIVTLIFRNYYDQIPDSIMESALIDGAHFASMYLKMFLPLSAPGFVVTCIWQFTQIWNEFLWGITLGSRRSYPITVELSKLAGGEAVSWNLPMAGSILTAVPVIIVFIFLGKYFIRGLLTGTGKG